MEVKDVIKKYIPPELTNTKLSVYLIMLSNRLMIRKREALIKAYDRLDEACKEYWWRSRSNNWLRMHGYPMRRRRRR